jgi:hypothetical protein
MMTKRTRTGLGRTLAAVLVVATLATSPLALAQTAETITGKVVNGTKDRPAAGVEVTLQLFSQQGDLGTVTDTTDERGRFAFEDLPEAVAGYQVIASYQGADFHTVAQAFTPGQTREETVTVFEPTSDPGAVTLTDYVVWVDRIDTGVAVQHDMNWNNAGTTAYDGDGDGVITVDLPPDATNLQFLGTFLEVPGEIRGDTFVSTAPIVPGSTTATLRYEAPPLSEMTLPLAFETTSFQLFVPEDVEVTSQQLRFSGTITDQGLTYSVYAAQDIAAGTEIDAVLSQAPAGGSTNLAIWILLGAFALLGIVVLVVWLVGRRRASKARARGRAKARPSAKPARPKADVEATARAAEPSTNGHGSTGSDEDVDLIVDEIAALDLSYEKGLLDERRYKRLRVAAKDRLLEAERMRTGGRVR